jgi:hypothetical protein
VFAFFAAVTGVHDEFFTGRKAFVKTLFCRRHPALVHLRRSLLHGEQAEKAGHKGRVEGVTHGGSGGAVAAV